MSRAPHGKGWAVFNNHAHLCTHCGQAFDQHSGPNNPLALSGACPSGKFPAWPKGNAIGAGARFDKRVAAFWARSKTTFKGVV